MDFVEQHVNLDVLGTTRLGREDPVPMDVSAIMQRIAALEKGKPKGKGKGKGGKDSKGKEAKGKGKSDTGKSNTNKFEGYCGSGKILSQWPPPCCSSRDG
eukprot:2403035-Amphidinium_carterae.1